MATRACEMDHLVVTAPTLAEGVSWLESTLGVKPQAGGEHVQMGTHNAVLGLGETIYLEVIAPNPAAAQPFRPRWFELDRLESDASPRLATWVARSGDVLSSARDCGYRFGSPEAMTRGRFSWLITVPPDGSLPGGGAIPTLIEWTVDEHPATGLQDRGCRLAQLEIFNSDSRSIAELLDCLGLRHNVVIRDLPAGRTPYLVAQIDTPGGRRSLSGRRAQHR